MTITLTSEFIRSLDSSAQDVSTAETLPPECYTDAEFYAFEKEAIFTREWLCVGRESWLAEPGDYFTTTIANEPMVIARNRKGEIKAMSSVCQHRAMLVAEGSGNARGFLCPYHHWAYSLDGDLVAAPAMNKTCDFDRKAHGLPNFKVELWHGFIFVNLDAEAEPLAPRLTQVAEAIAPYDLAKAEGPRPEPAPLMAWNWKVMFENNNDGYHASRLHHGPLHDFVPSNLAEFPPADPAAAGYLRYNGSTHPDASFNATQKAMLPIFPGLTEVERNRLTFANLPPTLSLVMTSDVVIYMILRPDSPQTHYMDTGLLVAPGAMKDDAFPHKLEAMWTATQHIIAQDFDVDAKVQIGLQSRYAKRGRYSWQEGAQAGLNNWLIRRYKAEWERRNPEPPVKPRLAVVGG